MNVEVASSDVADEDVAGEGAHESALGDEAGGPDHDTGADGVRRELDKERV